MFRILTKVCLGKVSVLGLELGAAPTQVSRQRHTSPLPSGVSCTWLTLPTPGEPPPSGCPAAGPAVQLGTGDGGTAGGTGGLPGRGGRGEHRGRGGGQRAERETGGGLQSSPWPPPPSWLWDDYLRPCQCASNGHMNDTQAYVRSQGKGGICRSNWPADVQFGTVMCSLSKCFLWKCLRWDWGVGPWMVGVFLDAVGGLQRNSWCLCKYDGDVCRWLLSTWRVASSNWGLL